MRNLNRFVSLLFIALTATLIVAECPPIVVAGSDSSTGAVDEKAAAQHDSDEKAGSGEQTEASGDSKYPPYDDVLEEAQRIDGLITLHRKDGKLYAELASADLNRDFLVAIAIARGMGERPLIGGMTWCFGDDWIWQFRKADDRIQIVRRNVRFVASAGGPEKEAVRLAYTDSVLFSLPIATTGPSGSYVIDMTSVFMSDLPQIGHVLRGFSFSRDKSSWASVKGFENNVGIEVAATYASSGSRALETVADSRGITVNIHYCISRLPETGYSPRLADDRVGYFLTVVKDYSKKSGLDHFVRYVNRWDLQKADPSVELSPPKQPIIFWLEKTVPFVHRKTIRDGILEWNKAFEKIGFANAIEVRQQPDDATWDPEDINYNTFRWITSSSAFAVGPSRVNPTSGQILDADILFDAGFLPYWQETSEVLGPDSNNKAASAAVARLSTVACGPSAFELKPEGGCRWPAVCNFSDGMARQLALGAMAVEQKDAQRSKAVREKLIRQGLKWTTMHEVGHTLGLRHNFEASAWLSLAKIADTKNPPKQGLAASVMDYLPINFAPNGKPQGDFFSTTLGPYDYWAIEYGYKPLNGSTEGEQEALKKIAARGTEAALQYGTDEDTRGVDPDPLCNRFDLGSDPVQFAKQRAALVAALWPGLVERIVEPGESYYRVRRAFNVLLSEHATAMYFAARFVGGVYVHRDHKGDPDARPPMQVVPAKRQREALKLVEREVFGPGAFRFPTEVLDYLAASHWSHWGVESTLRVDYPVHDVVLAWQERILMQLLSSLTLSRLLDSEMKVPANEDAFTAAELLERLTDAIFQETEQLADKKYTVRKPAISSLRRALQWSYLERLADLALANTAAPRDCQSIAHVELESLEARFNQVLAGKVQLDAYTKAHLQEMAARIRKVLDADLELRRP